MEDIRFREAIQQAKETELSRSLHVTEETMRAKEMLATMSRKIRAPLSGVLSIAEILATTKLDKEQYKLLEAMLSSGDLVLQLINDILDLSKVDSGAMKLEVTTFRPREVIKHVLRTAAPASLKKELTLEGYIGDDVPLEVIGDLIRIRKILTNLISNAVKFTHDGKVGINLHLVDKHQAGCKIENGQFPMRAYPAYQNTTATEKSAASPRNCDTDPSCCSNPGDACQNGISSNDNFREYNEGEVVWLRCDVYDTGIGIPEKSLPFLFNKYMQASTDHGRKYGGAGLGLAICKQLVELMGGTLTVVSSEDEGSTFTFMLPCIIPVKVKEKLSDDPDDAPSSHNDIEGYFVFKPKLRPSVLSSGVPLTNNTKLSGSKIMCYDPTNILEDHKSLPNGFTSLKENSGKCATDASQSNGPSVRRIDEDQDDVSMVSSLSGADIREERKTCKPLEEKSLNMKSKCSPISIRANILLVEDNKVNVMVAKSMLAPLGYGIDIVNNGIEAIRAVQRCQYDLILMDVHMPEMDGLQATRFIRTFENTGCWDASVKPEDNQMLANSAISSDCAQEKKGKRVPIIAMTGNLFSESTDECLAAGMDSCISKPMNLQKTKECLQRYLLSQ